MIFIADENIDRPIIERLRLDGHTLISILETGRGISDKEVLELSDVNEALLLTIDKDFGEIIYRTKNRSSGIILIRLAGLTNAEKADIVSECINKYGSEMLNSFSVISKKSVRIRKLRI